MLQNRSYKLHWQDRARRLDERVTWIWTVWRIRRVCCAKSYSLRHAPTSWLKASRASAAPRAAMTRASQRSWVKLSEFGVRSGMTSQSLCMLCIVCEIHGYYITWCIRDVLDDVLVHKELAKYGKVVLWVSPCIVKHRLGRSWHFSTVFLYHDLRT